MLFFSAVAHKDHLSICFLRFILKFESRSWYVAGKIQSANFTSTSEGKMRCEIDRQMGVASAVMWVFVPDCHSDEELSLRADS